MGRLLLAAAVLLGVAPTIADAQRRCDSEAERAAFEIQALRSELMVLATGCNEDNRYNAFIRKFQRDLQANERDVSTYFKRHFGRSAQSEHDRFVTEMANARSRLGTDLGTDFCPRNSLMFAEVLSLQNASDLAHFAAGKDLLPPALGICQDQHKPAATQVARAPAAKPAKP